MYMEQFNNTQIDVPERFKNVIKYDLPDDDLYASNAPPADVMDIVEDNAPAIAPPPPPPPLEHTFAPQHAPAPPGHKYAPPPPPGHSSAPQHAPPPSGHSSVPQHGQISAPQHAPPPPGHQYAPPHHGHSSIPQHAPPPPGHKYAPPPPPGHSSAPQHAPPPPGHSSVPQHGQISAPQHAPPPPGHQYAPPHHGHSSIPQHAPPPPGHQYAPPPPSGHSSVPQHAPPPPPAQSYAPYPSLPPPPLPQAYPHHAPAYPPPPAAGQSYTAAYPPPPAPAPPPPPTGRSLSNYHSALPETNHSSTYYATPSDPRGQLSSRHTDITPYPQMAHFPGQNIHTVNFPRESQQLKDNWLVSGSANNTREDPQHQRDNFPYPRSVMSPTERNLPAGAPDMFDQQYSVALGIISLMLPELSDDNLNDLAKTLTMSKSVNFVTRTCPGALAELGGGSEAQQMIERSCESVLATFGHRQAKRAETTKEKTPRSVHVLPTSAQGTLAPAPAAPAPRAATSPQEYQQQSAHPQYHQAPTSTTSPPQGGQSLTSQAYPPDPNHAGDSFYPNMSSHGHQSHNVTFNASQTYPQPPSVPQPGYVPFSGAAGQGTPPFSPSNGANAEYSYESQPTTSTSASARLSQGAERSLFKIEENILSLSASLERLGVNDGPKSPPLSSAAASLVLCVDIPDVIPNTATGAPYQPNDRDGHISDCFGTVDDPSIHNKPSVAGRFNYYTSFGRPIAAPGLSPTTEGLNQGDIYLHLDSDITQISVWQFRKESNLSGVVVPTWVNITSSYIENMGEVRHPTEKGCVLHCKPGIKPNYILAGSQETYVRRANGGKKAVSKTLESLSQGAKRLNKGKSRANLR
ncbi:hypothetical protein BJ165DRAFT_1410915 [Panaeolus papilionaceus]|nr:hypothetical protein BJ165DRAFT_1410915 [Panaeolus papilionaceus]